MEGGGGGARARSRVSTEDPKDLRDPFPGPFFPPCSIAGQTSSVVAASLINPTFRDVIYTLPRSPRVTRVFMAFLQRFSTIHDGLLGSDGEGRLDNFRLLFAV